MQLVKKREKVRLRAAELLSGITVGVPNYLSSLLLLKAVTKLPAYVVYPCYSVGAVLVVCVVSILFFKDRLTKHQAFGCGVILAALILLNV
ncbi:SMR family transporter [Hungatella effluvii]|uniref:SMR family transporter n=1 Tax=Hungatella effluvii TaxID=1096246 RepID=UPI0022E6523A|nr:SMR family transporter [Hungatella effluvii]